jgi:hypothetical protein
MGVVLIICPQSGKEVTTGIEIDGASFSQLPDVIVRSLCPDCGSHHAWWTHEARLQKSAEMVARDRAASLRRFAQVEEQNDPLPNDASAHQPP